MRKYLLLFLALMLFVGAHAYTCVSFKSGDPSILLKKAKISYEVVWNQAQVTNYKNLLFPQYLKKRGADFVRDWPEDRKKAEKYFTVRFNRKSDYMQIVNGSQGDYKLILRLATIDVGNGGSSFNPWASSKAGGVIMNGTIDFVDNRTGKVACVLNVINAKGSGSPSETVRIGLALSEIAADFCNFVEDDVKEGKIRGTKVEKTVSESKDSDEEERPSRSVRKNDKKNSVTADTRKKVADNNTKTEEDHTDAPKILVTDKRKYPASFNVKIGGKQMKMILVRGGRMNMGYDGRGSRRMHSEPVHKVAVTSFYISSQPLPASVAMRVLNDSDVDGEGLEPAEVDDYNKVEQLVSALVKQLKMPYRLPTEAEWEYAACSQVQDQIFSIASGKEIAYEWCSDFNDEFPEDGAVVTDPTGPESGREHVIRAYNSERGKFDRNCDMDDGYEGLIRLVIKANDYQSRRR